MTTIQNLDTSVDILSALLWQHNKANALQTLLQKKQDWYDNNLDSFWQNWERDVFDLRTATAFGRKVWSIILGIPLDITLAPTNKMGWGFSRLRKNFNHGNFSNKASSTVGLTADEQRLVLQLRYFKLISRCTVPEINRMLKYVFGSQGSAYVLDPLDMTFIIYVFRFPLSSKLKFIFQQYDLLPRPSTVGVKYQVQLRHAFGFGHTRKNFNNGNYQSEQ